MEEEKASRREELPLQMEYLNWESFNQDIERLKRENYHPLTIRDRCSVESYNKKVKRDASRFDESTQLANLTYQCSYGIQRKSRGRGERSTKMPAFTGCKVRVRAKAIKTEQGYKVVVTEQNLNHEGHTIGEEEWKQSQGRRRINLPSDDTLKEQIKLCNGDKKLFREWYNQNSNSVITAKDVHNIFARLKTDRRQQTDHRGGIHVGRYTVFIQSRAGIETTCYIDGMDVAFDMGVCFSRAASKSNVFISHGHIDHINAIPTHVARRKLQSLKAATYYVPPQLIPELTEIMQRFSNMQEDEFQIQAVPIAAADEIRIGGGFVVEPFPTVHRVDSFGFIVYREFRQLKPKFKGKPNIELKALRQEGVEINELMREAEVAYTGDTTIEVFETMEFLFQVRVLIMEVTFMDDRVNEELAAQKGHIHLNDVAKLADRFQNEWIIFMHCSARYNRGYVQDLVYQKFPQHLVSRIKLAI